jgi:hypothetical protein
MQERGRSGTSALGLRGSRRVGYHYLAPSPRHLRSRGLALSTLSPTADIGLIEFAFLSIGLGFNTGPLLSVAVPTAPAHAGCGCRRRQHGTNDRRNARGCRAWRHLCSARRPESR